MYPDKCLGCGICVIKCKTDALKFNSVRPPEFIPPPPQMAMMPAGGMVVDFDMTGAVFWDNWIGGVIAMDDAEDEYTNTVIGAWRAWSDTLCTDTVLSGDETDVDCGGACARANRISWGCDVFEGCIEDEDCQSGLGCVTGQCSPM